MFGLMKNLLKENSASPAETMNLADLHTGCVVGFGFMPQKSVSGKRVPVAEVNSYLFDAGNFIAYRLTNDSVDVNLIVADEEDPSGTYLALSQRIEPRLFDAFFPATSPNKWFALKEGDTVVAKPPVLGATNGWLASRYTVTVATMGRYLEGDWRMRKPTDRGRFSQSFDYVLLVDEDNEYALEAEKFEDGTLNIFATIYRPATDIGEITRPAKLVNYGSVESIPHVSLAGGKAEESDKPIEAIVIDTEPKKITFEEALKPVLAEKKTGTSLAEAFKAALAEATPEPQAVTAKEVTIESTEVVVASPMSAVTTPEIEVGAVVTEQPKVELSIVSSPEIVQSKFGRIRTSASQEQGTSPGDTLACDVSLAARIIDEAQRNKMLLSELVRKVIDLPARVQDQVWIPFALEPAEVAELARRYNLPASDVEGVKRQIIEELKNFVGDKN